MGWSGYYNYAIRQTLDSANRFAGAGMPCYLRVLTQVAQAAQSQEFVELGFQASASGVVTEDILIDPPPQIEQIPLRDIGLNAAQLSFGAIKIAVSHTFVLNRALEMNYTEPDTELPDFLRVFRDSSVVGIYFNSRLGKIVSPTHRDIGGAPYVWDLVVNFAEQPSQG